MFKVSLRASLFVVALMLCSSSAVFGQSTAFTYQGKLADNGNAANGHYDFQFTLFDASSSGAQQGTTQTVANQLVTNGIFAVTLDFVNCSGCSCPTCFNGGPRFLAIAVRPTGGGSFTPLTERQPITSTPYAVKSISAANATTADGLSVACINCITGSQIQSIQGSQVSGNIAGSQINGTIPVASVPDLGASYIKNTTSPQSSSNFNISGNGAIGGALGVGTNTPAANLDVTGPGIVRARINSTSNGGISLALSNQPRWSIATVTGGDLQIYNDATSHLAMSLNGTTSVISGDGSGLTNLNGANITDNTINASALASDTFQNSHNLSLLGSLRWDLLGQRVGVGMSPSGVAFDGANIWVTNGMGNTVTKLRASDGACVGTCTFAVGISPRGVAFDGANIWTANNGSSTVTKLRASDGANLGTFPVGVSPAGIAFDGANIWTANNGSANVTKLRASDGAVQGTFTVGTSPFGIAFDGANIFVANRGSNNVTKLRASDGSNLGTSGLIIALSTGIAFDGANIWVDSKGGANSVTRLRASDLACVGSCSFSVGPNPEAIAFDGANIWVTNNAGDSVTKVRASDGATLGTFTVGTAPFGIAFDGANMWVANSGDNSVGKLPVFP